MSSVMNIHWETAHSRQGIRSRFLDFGHYSQPVKPYGPGEVIALAPGTVGTESLSGQPLPQSAFTPAICMSAS